MKKMLLLSYLLIGSSLIMFILSLSGCQREHYKFIYKMGIASFGKYDVFGNIDIAKDSCYYDSLFIIQNFQPEILTSWHLVSPANNLYAYQPADPLYTPSEKLTEIKLYALKDYNANYPKGSDLSPICKFITHSNDGTNDSSKVRMLEVLNRTQYGMPASNLTIVLTEPPAVRSEQQFAFELRTEINELLQDTTAVIIIKP